MVEPVCCVEICKYGSEPEQLDRSFHRFPLNNGPLLELWLNALGCDETFVPTHDTFICSVHFRYDDYVKENGLFDISPIAVPSLHLRHEVNNDGLKKHIKQEGNTLENIVPKIIKVRGLHPNTNFANFPSESDYVLNEYVNVSRRNNAQIKIGKSISGPVCGSSNRNESNIIDSLNNIQITKNMLPCQKDNPGVSDQMYLSTSNSNNQNEMPSGVEIVEDNNGDRNSTKFVRLRPPLNSTNKTSKIYNIRNKCPTKMVISKSSKRSQTNSSRVLVSNQPQANYRHTIPETFINQLKLYARRNKRLIRKLKRVTTRQQDLLDTKIKYLVLREKLLETEEKLLANGIDTSEYPAFRLASEGQDVSKDNDYDVLLECTLEEVGRSNNNTDTISQSAGSSRGVQQSAENKSAMSEHSNNISHRQQ